MTGNCADNPCTCTTRLGESGHLYGGAERGRAGAEQEREKAPLPTAAPSGNCSLGCPDSSAISNGMSTGVELHFPRPQDCSRPSLCAARRWKSSPRGQAAAVGKPRPRRVCAAGSGRGGVRQWREWTRTLSSLTHAAPRRLYPTPRVNGGGKGTFRSVRPLLDPETNLLKNYSHSGGAGGIDVSGRLDGF